MTKKSQSFSYFRQFRSLVETPMQKIATLRTDRGGEYMSTEFKQFCVANGIHHQLTSGYAPKQNGVAERKNRHLLEGNRSVASGTHIPRYLWDEVAKAVNYIQNRLPCRALNLQTPEEAFSGQRPNLSHLRVIGCIAFCHVPEEKRTKLDYKAIPTIFLGYDEQSKAYRCWNPQSRKLVISRDVVFHVNQFTLNSSPTKPTDLLKLLEPEVQTSHPSNNSRTSELEPQDSILPLEPPPISCSPSRAPQSPTCQPTAEPPLETEPDDIDPQPLRQSSRSRAPSIKLGDCFVYLSSDSPDCCPVSVLPEEPPADTNSENPELVPNFKEAIKDKDWKNAMQSEIDSIYKNKT